LRSRCLHTLSERRGVLDDNSANCFLPRIHNLAYRRNTAKMQSNVDRFSEQIATVVHFVRHLDVATIRQLPHMYSRYVGDAAKPAEVAAARAHNLNGDRAIYSSAIDCLLPILQNLRFVDGVCDCDMFRNKNIAKCSLRVYAVGGCGNSRKHPSTSSSRHRCLLSYCTFLS
jgi:hypothetical protein